ncbi:MAG: hypothetical protein IJG40_16520 [Oscillospiraceae bacterium]|nr:hypothetical protein [Oscillospiraceae bacterium]
MKALRALTIILVVALVLCIAMVLSGCGTVTNQTSSETATPSPAATTSPVPTEIVISQEDELEIQFDELSDAELLDYVENAVYAELVELLDPDTVFG